MTRVKEIHYPNAGQSWGILGIAILSTLLFSPATILLQPLGKGISFLVYYLLAMAPPLGIAHLIRRKRTGINQYDLSFGSGKIMALIAIAMLAIQTGIILPIVNLIPMPELMKELFAHRFTNPNSPLSFLLLVLIASIMEEWLFRGIILDGLLRTYTPAKSIILSSVLFGILHLNPWQFVGATLIGLFSGWIYYRTKKLTLSILVHMTNNLAAFVGTHFSNPKTTIDKSMVDLYGGLTHFIWIVTGAVVLSVICIFLLKKEFGNLKKPKWKTTTSEVE